MTYKWDEFGQIKTSAELEKYLLGREYRHTQYCHYTSLKAIDCIIGGKTFWISNVKRFNDNWDSEQFAPNEQCYYSICFSTGMNENLALWYLYSGVDGQGGRIKFNKTWFRHLLDKATFTLCETNQEGKKKLNEVCKLETGSTMNLRLHDVLYSEESEDHKKYDLKYNTMTNHCISKYEFQKYKRANLGFSKSIIWYHEKETRLLIELLGEAREKLDPDKFYFVEMTIDESVIKKMEIDFAPEVSEKEYSKILKKYPYIEKMSERFENVKLSKYAGLIKMNLCRNCSR